jgi:hypothetical protein
MFFLLERRMGMAAAFAWSASGHVRLDAERPVPVQDFWFLPVHRLSSERYGKQAHFADLGPSQCRLARLKAAP